MDTLKDRKQIIELQTEQQLKVMKFKDKLDQIHEDRKIKTIDHLWRLKFEFLKKQHEGSIEKINLIRDIRNKK